MNEYVTFAKNTIRRMEDDSPMRSDSMQTLAAVALATALIGLAEIVEQGLTNTR